MLRIRKRRFLKIARIITMFMIGLFVAMLIALSRVNLETLRSDIINVLQESSGLPIEIEGDISWKLSLRPKVVLKKVVIKNADWATEKNGFYATKIDVTVNLLSLLQNRPSVEKLKIYDGKVVLEKNANGLYSIQSNIKNEIVDKTDDVKIQEFPFKMDFGLESLELHNCSANINGDYYYVSDLHINYKSKKDKLEYSGWLKSNAKFYPFVVSFSKFNVERKVYPLRIALSTGADALVANIALEGTSKKPIDFLLKGHIYNISELGQIFKLNFPYMSGVDIDIAGGMEDKKLNLRKCNIFTGGSDLKLTGGFDWSDNIPKINLNIKSDKFNLEKIFPKIYGDDEQPWVHPNRELNVFKNVSLFGELFNKYNLNLDVNIKQFDIYRKFIFKDVKIKADLKNSKMNMDIQLKAADGDLHLATDIRADSDNKLYVKSAGLAQRIYVGEIIKQVGYDNIISALPVNFEFYLTGVGHNLSELMDTISGPFYLYSVGPGYAHDDLVSNLYGTDFLTDLRHSVEDLFVKEKKYKQITISCAAINLKFREGQVQTKNGVAIETNAINTRFIGGADLGAETLHASMITSPVRGIKLSITGNFVNAVEFKGNMAEPDIKINKAAVAGKVASATGLGLLIAPFTGGLSIVAGAGFGLLAGDLLENWLGDDHPCRTAMEKGAPPQKGDPEWLNKSMAELVSTIIK